MDSTLSGVEEQVSDIRSFLVRSSSKDKSKFYGVQCGHIPGVYKSWAETKEQVDNYPNAKYKSFATQEEAENYVDDKPPTPPQEIWQPSDSLSKLNTEQRQAFDAILAGKSIFITGPGGTGKTFLLQNLYAHFQGHTGKKLAITAMTGCAALLLGSFAKTLHSWAGIGLARLPVESVASSIISDTKKRKRWRSTSCLVVDEVSMLSPRLLEYIDKVGRIVRKNPDKPFGGMQIVFVGDFYQLPPVNKDGKEGFTFESPLWNEIVQETVFLTQIIRQKDPVFQKILNEARVGEISPESYAILESRKKNEWKKLEIKPTLLFTKNNDVSLVNDGQLSKLTGKEHVFVATTKSPPRIPADILQMIVDKLDKDAPYEAELHIKEGAQVMLITNRDPEAGLVNGSRGIVTGFATDGCPMVRFLHGPPGSIKIERASWSSEAEKEEDSVHREQIPLRVAYALTIHKAQGASLDSALVDVGASTFEYGQAYVALSRVRNLDALYIFEISPKAFRAHPTVKAFYEGLQKPI